MPVQRIVVLRPLVVRLDRHAYGSQKRNPSEFLLYLRRQFHYTSGDEYLYSKNWSQLGSGW